MSWTRFWVSKGCFLCSDLWGNGNWVAAEWHEAICFATSTWLVCSSEWSLEMKPNWHLFYTKAFEENVEGDFEEKWMEPIQWPTFPRHPGARGLIEQSITLLQSGLGKPWRATATCKICSRQTLTLLSFLPSEIRPYSRESHVFFFTSGCS